MALYPVNIEVVPDAQIPRWRALVNLLLALPTIFWMALLQWGAMLLVTLGWFSLMFTGRLPRSWGDYLVGTIRYQMRINGFVLLLTSQYPGFAVAAGYVDPGDRPTVAYSARPLQRNRVTVFFRWFMAIPQFFVLFFIGIAAAVVFIIGWFSVLILGRWPDALRDFTIGYLRWRTRVIAYLWLLVDEYPPFGFEE